MNFTLSLITKREKSVKVYELIKKIQEKSDHNPERIIVSDSNAGVTVYDSEDFRTYDSDYLDVVLDLFRFSDKDVLDFDWDGFTLRIVI